MSNPVTIVLFSKIPGKVAAKTRLCSTGELTKEQATKLAQAFLIDVIQSLKSLAGVSKYLVSTPLADKQLLIEQCDNLPNPLDESDLVDFNFLGQEELEFGDRLQSSLDTVYNREASAIVVVGSDAPMLSSTTIERAINHVAQGKYVVGPTPDGGIYLIGLPSSAFDIGFSVADLFSQTEVSEVEIFASKVKEINAQLITLEQLSDIDIPDDLIGLKAILVSTEIEPTPINYSRAENSRAAIKSLSISTTRDSNNNRAIKLNL